MLTTKRLFYSIILLTLYLFSGCQFDKKSEVNLQIIGTTDIHGSIFSFDFIDNKERAASLGALTGYLDSLKKQGDKELILLDNGDILQGQPPVYYYNYIDTTNPHVVSRVLNFMEYDASAVGNHDIETGHAVYDKIRDEFRFPWLAANAIDTRTNKPYFQPYTIIERSGIKIAVLGMVTPAIPNWLPEKVYSGITFEDMVESSEKWVKLIHSEKKPDLLVGLFHSGYGDNEQNQTEENAVINVAREVEGLDIIFYGHDHRLHYEEVRNNAGETVFLLNPGPNAKKAALVDLTFAKQHDKWILKSLEGDFLELNRYEPSESFQDEFKPYSEKVKQYVSKEITFLPETLQSTNALFGPSKWMQLIHEVQMDYTGADLSFSAPLSVYSTMDKGIITTGDLFKFYRFRNLLYTIRLKGREIHDYLEYSYSDWFNQMESSGDYLLKFKLDSNNKPAYSREYGHYLLDGTYYNFDSGYGIDYTVDVSKPEGDRVDIKLFSNGEPFIADNFYKVAINSYRANGGGGHLTQGAGLTKAEIKNRIITIKDEDIRYLIEDKISKQDSLKIGVEKNWKIKPYSWWNAAKTRDSLLLFNSN